jgi:Zn-dependent protease with chaperone function
VSEPQYHNPKVREGINVSRVHPLAEFAGLLAGVLAIGGVLTVAAYLLAGALVPFIPFSAERAILDTYDADGFFREELTPMQQEVEGYLNALAGRLLEAVDLPDGLVLQVHYSDSEQMNAFATLGGHVVVNRGLLASLKSENALAMVLGHEIGHVLHRHPMLAMGRTAVTVGALALLSGFSQTRVANTLFSISADSLMLGFSREQERAADLFGLELLERLYGHRAGADEFFRQMQAAQQDTLASDLVVEFFSTHPDLEERIELLRDTGVDGGATLVALPIVFKDAP